MLLQYFKDNQDKNPGVKTQELEFQISCLSKYEDTSPNNMLLQF